MGTAILWLPFYLAAHLWFGILNLLGGEFARAGFGNPYQQAVGLGTLTYGCAGLYLSYRAARAAVGSGYALAATITVCSGGFLLWYLIAEASYPHGASFFAVAAFLTVWHGTRNSQASRDLFVVGLLAGLMTIVRWQNILWAVPFVALEIIERGRRARAGGEELAALARVSAMAGAGFMIAVLPQLLLWRANFGGLFTLPPLMAGSQWWGQPLFLDVLFSSNHGLFSTHPLLYLSVLGIPLLIRENRALGTCLAVAFLAQICVNAAVGEWWGGAAFGARRFAAATFIFVLGLAYVLRAIALRPRLALALVLVPFVALNLTLAGAMRAGSLPAGSGIGFDRISATLYERVGNPFAFPATLLFARSWGVSPSQYDRLGEQQFNHLDIDVGGNDDRFLLRGWHGAESGGGSFRWAANTSSFAAPLKTPGVISPETDNVQADYSLSFDVAPLAHPDGQRQTVSVEVNGTTLDPVEIGPGRNVFTVSIPGTLLRRHLNHIALRHAWAVTPASIGINSDGRRLAARYYQLRLQRR
ncbi:MAG: hypothetical protein GKS06_12065 [Acidobacteria bacterium]|nr:hypothetical protein [Acidobacteriota bacterium]